jgi:diguanylate cyclase (GGDEF)-like protein/PAS domain S-box-containing protein
MSAGAARLLGNFQQRPFGHGEPQKSGEAGPIPWRFRTSTARSRWIHYALAALLTLGLLKVETALRLVWPGSPPALTVLLLPVVLVAALGGVGPGLAATALGAFCSAYVLILPMHRLALAGTPTLMSWIGFVVAGAAVSVLSELLHRARFRAETNALRFRFLARVGTVLSSSLDYAQTLANIAELASEGPASVCTFHLRGQDGLPSLVTQGHATPLLAQRLARAERFLQSECPGNEHPVLKTMQTGLPLLIPAVDDAWMAAHATSDEHLRIWRELGMRSLLIVPVVDPSGSILGALSLVLTAEAKTRYGEDDLAFAEELGRRAGTAIVNARNYAREAAYRRMVDTTHDGIVMLDADELITFVNARMVQLLGYSDATEIVERPLAEFLLSSKPAAESEREELCFRHRDGSSVWTLAAASQLIGFDGTIAQSLKMITDITERKRAENELAENAQRFRDLAAERHHAAYHDALTGLPNRAAFLMRLGEVLLRMERHPELSAAVLFADIDRFKVINDSLGHGAGDRLLAAFAQRLTGCVRPYDAVARLGGDEFTILLDDVVSVRDATLLAERILRAIERPFSVAGRDVSITASIGIAFGKAEDAEAMLRDADTAMYRAKELGGARYELFAPELHSKAMARLELEIELRRALERRQLSVAYQPIFSIETGRITGFEALARWNHAGQTISPNVFIPIAEETGLILPLGEWVLAEACRQARIWHGLRPAGPSLSVSVNVSAKQLAADSLASLVSGILAETGLRPEHLRLEITESVLLARVEAAESALDRLRSLGVQIDLDDFGTGYSSLAYLQRLPINTIKIDRSFISGAPGPGISNPEIVAAIVAMAQSLGLETTAEGVETEEQLHQLQALRCTNAQGYYFSRPVDSAAAGLVASAT